MPTRTLTMEPEPGVRLVADQLDGSGVPLLYLHGLTSTRVGEKSEVVFRHAAAQQRSAWRFDQRGHGESDGVIGEVTLSELVHDAAHVLEQSGPAFVIGSSLGGLVASWTASKHPDLVRGLVLLAPALRFLPRLKARMAQTGSMALDHSSGAIHLSDRAAQDLLDHDEATMMMSLKAPTFIVHGDADETVPVEVSQELHAAIPHDRKELWIIEGGDHRLTDPIQEILDRAERFHDW